MSGQKSEVKSQKSEGENVSVVRAFHDLDVYQKAYRFSLDVHKATLGFPKLEQYALALRGDEGRATLR